MSAASCQERLQPVDVQHHPSPHTYRKSLRLSSDQIVSSFVTFSFDQFYKASVGLGYLIKSVFFSNLNIFCVSEQRNDFGVLNEIYGWVFIW